MIVFVSIYAGFRAFRLCKPRGIFNPWAPGIFNILAGGYPPTLPQKTILQSSSASPSGLQQLATIIITTQESFLIFVCITVLLHLVQLHFGDHIELGSR